MKLSRCQTPSGLAFSLLSIEISQPKHPLPLGSLAKILIAPKVLVIRRKNVQGGWRTGLRGTRCTLGTLPESRSIWEGRVCLESTARGTAARGWDLQGERGFRESLAFEWEKRTGGLCCLKGGKTLVAQGEGFHSAGSTSSCPSSIAVAACSGTGQLEKGSHHGQGGCPRLWADAENDPAWRDLFPLPGSSVPGTMARRVVAASNICGSALGCCQPTSHLWQLEVSWWPTAWRLSQGLDVFLEKQIGPS